MKTVAMPQGYEAIVDDEDYELVSGYRWWVSKRTGRKAVYAIGSRDRTNRVMMHRLILNPPKGFQIDHKNGNGLDNRKENLRVATQSQNLANQKSRGGVSRFKGVTSRRYGEKQARPRLLRWVASIYIGGKRRHLGAFQTEEEAARAYDAAAKQAWGAFAFLNFPVTE